VTDEGSDEEFEQLLSHIKEHRGFDFTGYKRASLLRRVTKRMREVGVPDFPAYQRHLDANADEFAALFDTILINVTGFYRDPAAWDYLAAEVIPALTAEKGDEGSIRVWSAACSSGEEPFTIAMLLCDALGEDAYRQRVKIYATDVDEQALAESRNAFYPVKAVSSSVPPHLVERYFELVDGGYGFRKDLRRTVIFGRHDLVQDPPISRTDLLICRNTLMYFTAETQLKILGNFHFSLNDNGFLFLGKSEVLVARTNLFAAVDLRRRVFAKVPRDGVLPVRPRPVETPEHVDGGPLRDVAFDAAPISQIVIDENGILVQANHRARRLFGVRARDLGRPFRDVDLSYRPTELRSRIEEASDSRHVVTVRDVQWETSAGEVHWFDVEIVPLAGSDGRARGVGITFSDTTRYKWLEGDLQKSQRELETAYEELQSTVEELETTNEELQSTNEELETTNEELQSTNEELETINEELQSTNEELETMNDEFRQRSEELNDSNAYLQAILGSLTTAVVVANNDLKVEVWNSKAQELWGLRPDEVEGQHLLNLDIGLPVEQLRQPIRDCIAGTETVVTTEVDATNRRGRAFVCVVTITPLNGANEPPRGAIILMEEKPAD
jgi:two-component system CheB/CheR fusion protein